MTNRTNSTDTAFKKVYTGQQCEIVEFTKESKKKVKSGKILVLKKKKKKKKKKRKKIFF